MPKETQAWGLGLGRLAVAGATPAGEGAAVTGMWAILLKALEPPLRLSQCDLRDDSITSLELGPEATQRTQGKGKGKES